MNNETILDESFNNSFPKKSKLLWACFSILTLTSLFSVFTIVRLKYSIFLRNSFSNIETYHILHDIFSTLSITLALFIFLKNINPKSINFIPFLLASILVTILGYEMHALVYPFINDIYHWWANIDTTSFPNSSWSYDGLWRYYLNNFLFYLMVSVPPAIGVFFLLKYKNKWLLPLLLAFLIILQHQTHYLFF
jgi:hypothetical protein